MLTDPDLGIGVDKLEGSVATDDGFTVVPHKAPARNRGNVETIVFESPRVFSNETATLAEEIIGKKNLLRIENRSHASFDVDPVVHVSPEIFGFKHIGSEQEINTDFFIGRHYMTNVAEPSIQAIKDHRANIKKVREEVPMGTKIVNTFNEIKDGLIEGGKTLWDWMVA